MATSVKTKPSKRKKSSAQEQPDKKTLLELYRSMQVIRQTEMQLARAHTRGLIHGACHTYVGEEAIAAGVCANLRKDDAIFSTHRGHGHALAKGVPPRELMAELFGRETGCSHGRGGSMHLFKPEIGLMGTSGIVAPCILQATGAGYSFKLLKTDQVGVAFFGDGAVNNGAFHEGLNLASIWNLPVLFVCENNQFATEVPFSYSSANPSVGGRGEMYNMAGFELDGNDVVTIFKTAREAVLRARGGGGPTVIGCVTYRTRAHSEGMGDYTYRTRKDVEEWRTRCPIERLKQHLLDERITDPSELEAIDQETKETIKEAQDFAEKSPYPDPATAKSHVFYEGPDGSGASKTPIVNDPPKVQDASALREITYMQATVEALSEEMAKNPKLFIFGEGIGKRGGNFAQTTGLYDLFGPMRLCDTPICERGFTGVACGAAMAGTRPIVDYMFWDFALDAVGEIINQIAKIQYMSSGRLKMPIVLRGAGGAGHSACTHHSGNYYPLFAHFPGFRVVIPTTPYDAKGLLKRALNCNDPVLFLESREMLSRKGHVPKEEYEIEFGKACTVHEGTDVTVVAISRMVPESLQACQQLKEEGISVELIDPRTLVPLDMETILQSVRKTGRLLIADETFAPYGIGGEITAQVIDAGFDDLDAPVRRLHGESVPIPYSPSLEKALIPRCDHVIQAVRDLAAE